MTGGFRNQRLTRPGRRRHDDGFAGFHRPDGGHLERVGLEREACKEDLGGHRLRTSLTSQ